MTNSLPNHIWNGRFTWHPCQKHCRKLLGKLSHWARKCMLAVMLMMSSLWHHFLQVLYAGCGKVKKTGKSVGQGLASMLPSILDRPLKFVSYMCMIMRQREPDYRCTYYTSYNTMAIYMVGTSPVTIQHILYMQNYVYNFSHNLTIDIPISSHFS